jgi:hypothetical protein
MEELITLNRADVKVERLDPKPLQVAPRPDQRLGVKPLHLELA